MPYHVSKPEFGRLVEESLESLPEPFKSHLEEMRVEIRDRPTAAELKRAGLVKNELLLGLYVGLPTTERSVLQSAAMPDVIYIFQDAIEQVVSSERALVEQVRITVLHEIGHHFGMNEEDLRQLGYG